jgi:hypothetical protein
MLLPGILASGISGHLITSNFYSIQTVTVSGTSTTSISFSSIPQTYKSLQLRILSGIYDSGVTQAQVSQNYVQFNGDTGNNYTMHYLYGNSASTVAAGNSVGNNVIYTGYKTNNYTGTTSGTAVSMGVTIIDIIDYSNTSKYKTLKYIGGANNNDSSGYSAITIGSGLWLSTSAITSMLFPNYFGGTFYPGTTFALYGIN